MFLRTFAPALLAASFLGAAQAATPAAAPTAIPVQNFFARPSFTGVTLSPSGNYLAAKITSRNGRDALIVVDLADSKVTSVAHFTDVDVGDVQWITDDKLLFDSVDRQNAAGDRRFGPGLFTVNRDGTSFRQLADRTAGNRRVSQFESNKRLLPWHTFMLNQRGAQDSATVYVRDIHVDVNGTYQYEDLLKLDTTNGRATIVRRPADTNRWLLDEHGEPRLAASNDKGQRTYWLRDTATGDWRALATFAAYLQPREAFAPLGFGPDGKLYAIATPRGDFAAVHTVDLATGALSAEPLLKLDGYDFRGSLVQDADKVLGIRYLTDTWGTVWFDAAMRVVQAEIDAQLPGTVNLLTVPRKPGALNLLVRSFSDTQPNVYYVYNRETHKLARVGNAHENIEPPRMGHQQLVSYKARDGLTIPALLTLPPGTDKPAGQPMVVLVHGGPWTRGSNWGWDPEAQFLASRGYVVLQPEFRGSTGFGVRHFRAGLKEWGGKMQDDLADGARWAIAQGYADGGRVCIAGEAYGGYAALMGLVRDGDLYRCGVARAAVTNLDLLVDGGWGYRDVLPDEYRQYGLKQLVGDPDKDAALLQAASPLAQAARIRRPVLLAYGERDRQVPIVHGNRLRSALREHNPDVEWIEYDAEDHDWSLPANRADFWTKVERFLDRNIGAGAKP